MEHDSTLFTNISTKHSKPTAPYLLMLRSAGGAWTEVIGIRLGPAEIRELLQRIAPPTLPPRLHGTPQCTLKHKSKPVHPLPCASVQGA